MGTSFDYLLNALPNPKPKPPTLPGVVVNQPDFESVHKERTKRLGVAELQDLLRWKKDPEAVPDSSGDPDPKVIKQLREQMLYYGTTLDQHRKAYMPRVSETLYQQITPSIYKFEQIPEVIKKFFDPTYSPDPTKPVGDNGNRETAQWKDAARRHSEDAWRLYLGLPQVGDSFTISRFRPSNAKTNDVYFKFADPGELSITEPENLKGVLEVIDSNKKKFGRAMLGDYNYTLGDYQLTKGQDKRGNYVAYYDKWDLAAPHADKIGHPFEVYDRIYYDPKTYKVLPDSVVLHNERMNNGH